MQSDQKFVRIDEKYYKMLLSMAAHRGRTITEELEESIKVRNYNTFSNENQRNIAYRRNKFKRRVND